MKRLSYVSEWDAAAERSIRFGLEFERQPHTWGCRYLTDERCAAFPSIMSRELGELGVGEVVAQCLAIHLRLLPIVERWLECPVFYTIGWIDNGSERGRSWFCVVAAC